jgi:EAL domain-containing protein (putative c-di-GMP-specific phosphodiesterase class I)
MSERETLPVFRVVVIDDHEMILQSVVRLLTADPQITVVGTASTASEGIDIVQHELPDVVVIDYHLSDMDAPQAIPIILEIHPEVKIVTFSGSERPGALYSSIRAGSNAWVRKTRAIQELRTAVLRLALGEPFVNEEMAAQPTLDQLVLHYQPIVALDDGHIVGFEALVRWMHPQQGLLYPESFLPYAEDTGYVEEIDRWVRDQAISQLVLWQEEFFMDPPLWMSINISACDISNPELFEAISDAIASSTVKSADLVVEVRESVLFDDSEVTNDFLAQLKGLGVGMTLDDFGTAFSSISFLRRFPFDRLKLDMSFTSELPHSKRSMLLIEEICHMAESMKLKSIAGGIERRDQMTALHDVGWEFGQGYLFSPPLGAAGCMALLSGPTLLPALAPR